MIHLHRVESRSDRKRFVRLPEVLYRDEPAWVAPLRREQMAHLDPRENPFFTHSEAALLLASRHGVPVGRIAAIHNRRHLEVYGDGTGFFGFFESVDDPEVAGVLLEAAREWLLERGLTRMRGPVSFTINDEAGLLLDAFEEPPVLLMPYNPPYYRRLLEGWGLVKAHDLYAYRLDAPEAIPPALERVSARAAAKGIRVRTAELDRFDEEVERIHRIHSRAWAGNWGAVPLTLAEVRNLAGKLREIVDPELVLLAERHGEPMGVSVTLPDLNQALAHLGGRLLPFGWLRLLRERRRIDALRVLILGVLPEHRHLGVEATMIHRTLTTGLAKGYRWAELSWVLESNRPMLRLLGHLGARRTKTYRLYEREI